MSANFVPQPVVAPVTPTYQTQGQQMPNRVPQQKGPNIWYRPIAQTDYPKLAEMGSATIVVRFLPGFNQHGLYEAIFEKNNANSKFPDSKQWLVPVLVCSDSLHPEKNGFVGVMTVSKTLYNRIKSKATPQNYFDFNAGFNFHINVSLQQSKDGQQWFPNYSKSGFETTPTACPVDYVVPKMNEGKFGDFSVFMQRINNPQPKSGGGMSPAAVAAMAGPAQTVQGVAYGTPQTQAVKFSMPQPQATPVAAANQFTPTAAFVPAGVPPTPVAGGEEEFDQIFNQ